ncbi:hypothetical protein GOP47_0008908 [Adiantum capillus-veneris]|uniref:Importin N-terminal domain-containing protein n=1 Tax=Adiantum capillus-veneris TaxID=13818 RepID=A0A9D4UZF9_ADICA|nr:hypothetical protein GOP47_0008908 [Adiantum capillus-veneris]
METQATLLHALQALYHDPKADTRGAANQWLQEFQHSLEAWQISDNLLHNPSSTLEVLYFCAQTLRTKIQRDFDDLPTSSRIPLRDSVLILLKRFQHGPASVRTQLCLALAALAIHIPAEEWGRGGVMNWLKEEICTSNEGISSLLELLTVLPQEAYSHKTSVRPERRRQFQKELVTSTQDAFQTLTDQLSRNTQEYLDQIIGAFAAWLHLSHGLKASILASHPLVAAALSGLTLDKSFDAAVDAVTELIRYTVSGSPGGLAEQMPLIQIIVPHVMALRSRFAASLKIALADRQLKIKDTSHVSDVEGEEEDLEVMKGLAQLFAELGESYVDFIANGSGQVMMIVEALVEVTSHPDDTIAEITFNFWYRLSSALSKRELYKGFDSERVIELEMERRVAIFRPIFELLLSLVSYRVKFPEGFETWRKDEMADFKQTRYAVADVLMDAAAVLGGERTLQLLASGLLQGEHVIREGVCGDWQSLEASLYCIRGIAKAVPSNEATVMPQVMLLLTQLPAQQQLQYTVFLTIAAYADWLGVAPSASSLLPHLLNLLATGFSIPDDPAAAAALAFKHVCDACRNILGGLCIDALVNLYSQAMSKSSKYQLSAEDELQIVEGLSMVVSAMPVDQTSQILEALCLPVATSLEEVVTESQMARHAREYISSRNYTVSIDRLSNIFRYVNHPEPLANSFRRLWPLLKNVFIQMGSDMRTMERLCRLCKYVVRVCGRFLGDIVVALLEQVQEQFQQHHQSCFLYLASEVMKVFSGDQSCGVYLGNLVFVLFGQAINLLSSIEMFTAHPDIADDCFLLASRCIRYCPHLLVPTPVFPALIDCAMTGVTIQHREACFSILTFLQDIFNMYNSVSGQQYRDVIDSVLLPRGPTMCRILIGALVGAVPESRVEEVMGVILSLAQSYGMNVVQWAENTVHLIPASVASEEEQKAFLQALASAASGGGESAALRNSIEQLSDVCRRSKKLLELVQSVLRPHQLALTC